MSESGSIWQRMEKFWEYGSGRTVLAALCAHSVSISIGICQGYSAILIPQLVSSSEFAITVEEGSWLASLGAITNPLGSILSGFVAEYCGRKTSMQISSVPFVLGWLCIAFGRSIDWLYAGRLITGIAAGMSTASYTYVSEISLPESRGFLQALGPISASFGILFTYITGYFLHWATVAKLSIVFSTFTIISIGFLPESPAYYLKKRDLTKSFEIYLWFRRNNAMAQQEIERNDTSKDAVEGENIYLTPQTIKPFFILIGLFLLQQLSGIYTILFYAVNFFQETDLEIDDYISSIIVGSIRFTMAILGAVLINRFGRRILCVFSSFGMAIAMIIVTIYIKYYEMYPTEERILPHLPLFAIIFNVLFSMVGMLPIPWILVGEMFPLQVRSIMGGIVICIAQSFIFICVKVYNDMLNVLSFSGTLFFFSMASVLTLVYCKTVLPETKNKSLSEIEEHFKRPKKKLYGYDNKGFKPETDFKTKNDIFTLNV